MAQRGKRKRHIPQRTCVGCRQVAPKRTMTRVVRTPEGVIVDPTGKVSGRGAYLHNRPKCWEKGLQGGLTRALKTELTAEDRERLKAFVDTLTGDAIRGEGNDQQRGQGR